MDSSPEKDDSAAKNATDALRQALKEAGCSEEVIDEEMDQSGTIVSKQEYIEEEFVEGEESQEQGEKGRGHLDSVLVKDEDTLHLRPSLTWPQLIAEALDEAENRTLTANGVFCAIEDKHPFFQGLGRKLSNSERAHLTSKVDDKMIIKWQKVIKGTLKENKKFHCINPTDNNASAYLDEFGITRGMNGKFAAKMSEANLWTIEVGMKEKMFAQKANKAWFSSDSPKGDPRRGPGAQALYASMPKVATAKDRAKLVQQIMAEDQAENDRAQAGEAGQEAAVVEETGDEPMPEESPEKIKLHPVHTTDHYHGILTETGKHTWKKRLTEIHKHWQVCKDMFGETVLKCIYPCDPPCRYTSKGTDNMKGHVNTVHIQKFLYCNICGRPYLSYRILKEHMNFFHKQKCYPCTFPNCNFKSVDTDLIEDHYWMKHKSRDVPEEYRPIHPSKRLEWKDKKVKVNRNKPMGPKPGTGSKSYPPAVEKLITMIANTSGAGPPEGFVCKICDHSCVKKQNMAAHIKVKHLDIQTKCPEPGCSFTSGYWYNIQAHLKKQHNWKEIDCMIPGCKFKTVEDKKMQLHLTKIHNAKYDETTHSLICFA